MQASSFVPILSYIQKDSIDAQAIWPVNKDWQLTLNVGVRRPFSMVNGSGTKVTAFANSKPLNCKNKKEFK